jgi:hypothetical protein
LNFTHLDSTRLEIPLSYRRRKLAFGRGFQGQADRIQNHLFSLTAERTMRLLGPSSLNRRSDAAANLANPEQHVRTVW